MGKTANKQVICEVLMEAAKEDRSIVALCSDSRGSGSFTPFADTYPEQFVETGIAEQNLVSIAAGLAKCGKKAYAVSPACFLSARSYEQCKVDVAYSDTNVKLIGISGGQLRRIGHESSFSAGYRSYERYSEYEGVSAKRPSADKEAYRGLACG